MTPDHECVICIIKGIPIVITTQGLQTNEEYIPILDLLSLQNEQVKCVLYR